MQNLDDIRTEEQKAIAAANNEFWGSYFAGRKTRTPGDIAIRIAQAKTEHGAYNAADWMEKATALKEREISNNA